MTITATNPTVLELFGMGVAPYSARGLSQTLDPIQEAASFERAIDGSLMNLSYEPFRKYHSVITGNDQDPPACDGVWPGKEVTVYCIEELGYDQYGAAERSVVPGSERSSGGFTFYRPILAMVVTKFTMTRDEYTHQVQWSLELEEA